jgi:hypothetical protein
MWNEGRAQVGTQEDGKKGGLWQRQESQEK